MGRFWYFDVSRWWGVKNLAFQCCAKMVGLIRHGSILHGLSSQVNPQRLPSSFDIAKYHPNTPRLSLRHPKTSPNSIRHYRHHRISSQTFKVVYLGHQYMRSWMKVDRSHPTILAQQWNAIFFSIWSLWDIKIPKPPNKSFLKIIGLGHFLQFLGSSERYCLLQSPCIYN